MCSVQLQDLVIAFSARQVWLVDDFPMLKDVDSRAKIAQGLSAFQARQYRAVRSELAMLHHCQSPFLQQAIRAQC